MSAKDLEDMTLEKFSMWTVVALKAFLKKKGLNQAGCKKTLTARAFCAWENKVEDCPTAKEIRIMLANEYQSVLTVGVGQKIPDPSLLNKGWVGEESGMNLWPPTFLSDISDYLKDKEHDVFSTELRARLLKDYKDQKSFSFFSSKWLLEVHYHPMQPTSEFCVLKADCTPSQAINNPPYTAWVCIRKDTGKILSAYCSCFAGFGQSCNHVAAILLKVDYCWRMGYVSKSCTSKECSWNKPSGGASVVNPQKIRDLNWQKPTATAPHAKKLVNPPCKKLFCPTRDTQKKGMNFDTFLSKLKDAAPNAVCNIERSADRLPRFETGAQHIALPPNPQQLALNCTEPDELIAAVNSIDSADVLRIQINTLGQGDNPSWISQRTGRLTASNFHDIKTRMSTTSMDMSRLTARICGYSEVPEIPAIKYGRNMEAEAIEHYLTVHKRRCGQSVRVQNCGLFIHPEQKFLGASPDAIVACTKCGLGLLEVKCPLSSAHTAPTPTSVKYLKMGDNGEMHLRTSHKYYTQVQGQIAIAERPWCDFFVYSRHGHHLQRIEGDDTFWSSCLDALVNYYTKFMAVELITQDILNQASEVAKAAEDIAFLFDGMTTSDEITVQSVQSSSSSVLASPLSEKPVPPKHDKRKKTRPSRKQIPRKKPVYTCLKCQYNLKNEEEICDESEQSIECDMCKLWCCVKCSGLTVSQLEDMDENEAWLCFKCIDKS